MHEASGSVANVQPPPLWPEAPGSMWDWWAHLPLPRAQAVTLGEGMTPLIRSRIELASAPRLALHWKNEGLNPTGSQKDRAMSLALTDAKIRGAKAVAIASTGSAGFSCAAYAARAGIPCVVLVPRGTPQERLVPMRFHGAHVLAVDGSFEEIEDILAGLNPARWYQASTVARLNPIQATAPATIAFEIVHQLGHAPDHVVVPIGGGATIAGIWRGFEILRRAGRIARSPRLVGIQPVAFCAVGRAFREGLDDVASAALAPPAGVDTILRNLKHVLPPDGDLALAALRESRGVAVEVSDAAALAGQSRLAREDGIFCEPSCAVVLDAVAQAVARGAIGASDSVVGIVTGSGLREMGSLAAPAIAPIAPSACAAAMEAALAGRR